MALYDEWSEALERDLAMPFPPEQIKQKKAGKGESAQMISFVPVWRYVERLNALVGGGWSMGTPIIVHLGDKLLMGLPITIHGVTRINWGDEDDSEYETKVNTQTGEEYESKTMYGSPVTNAFAQSFKRTCALFGMGLDMYLTKGGAKTAPQNRPAQSTPNTSPSKAAVPKCEKCGGAMWDNRPKKASGEFKPNSPDFACKDKTCKHAVWEEKATDPVAAVKLQDALNRAALMNAVTIDQSARIEKVLDEADADHMATALAWLETQMQKRLLAGDSK